MAPATSPAKRVTEVRPQQGEEMQDVRQTLVEWRAGNIDTAISILDQAGRVVIAEGRDELMTAVVADWYGDRQRRREDPELEASSMMTERHRDRRELSTLARQYLVADGTLTGPVLHAEDLEFQKGDEVMALEHDRDFRRAGSTRRGDFVHTAEKGVVLEVHRPTGKEPGSLTVDFAPPGPVEVPMEYLTRRLDRGITGGLAHSCALTTNAAQGGTYDAASPIATDSTSAKRGLRGHHPGPTRGTPVHGTRSRPRPRQSRAPEMPRLEDNTTIETAVINQLKSDRDQVLAREVDPLGRRVATCGPPTTFPSSTVSPWPPHRSRPSPRPAA